jgi:peroxiredoxin
MKKILFILSLISIFIYSCNNKGEKSQDEFIIKCDFTKTKNDTVYLEELLSQSVVPIDSTIIDKNGKFTFKYKPEETSFYVLRTKKSNSVILLIDKGENINITADVRQISKTYTIKGSKGSELIRILNAHIYDNYDKLDSLQVVFQERKNDSNFVKVKKFLDSTYYAIFKDQNLFIKDFIDKNPNSLASLIAIHQSFNRRRILSPDNDFEYFKKLDKNLMKAYPDNTQVIDFHKIVEHLKLLAVGSVAPNITLNNTDGNPVALSSLRGKTVFLVFWASWCHFCKEEIPNLVSLYDKYKDDGFEIYGVSLDKDKQAWLSAIKNYKISWIQVSDTKAWGSPVIKLYNLKAIPATYLLDKNGKIITKNIQGKELATKLTEIFKK